MQSTPVLMTFSVDTAITRDVRGDLLVPILSRPSRSVAGETAVARTASTNSCIDEEFGVSSSGPKASRWHAAPEGGSLVAAWRRVREGAIAWGVLRRR
jgi:hypothetical protein